VGKQTKTSIKKGKETRRQVKVEAEVEEMKREGRELRPATSVVKQQVSYHDGESTMKANVFLQSAYGKWMVKELDARGFITKNEALNGGAYVSGGSQVTLYRYLKAWTSLPGPLEEFTADDAGEVLILFKARFLELRKE
jgi:predicted transcriptional regulator YheO